jgi:predicted amidophosphoribosyltransferase
MPDGAPEALPLAEKLRAEQRRCPRCQYEIADPLTDRCPRCYEPVARVETNCGECSHQGSCEFARVASRPPRD